MIVRHWGAGGAGAGRGSRGTRRGSRAESRQIVVGVGRPHGRDLGHDRTLAEPARVASVAQELADGRRVRATGERPHLAVEAQLVADQPPEAQAHQVRALREQPPPRVRELEPPVVRRDRHPHLGVLDLDPELAQQRRERRVVAVIVDDEPGVDPALPARIVDADRVRVPADAALGLVEGDRVGGVEGPRGGEAGDPGADDGDSGSVVSHAQSYATERAFGSGDRGDQPQSSIDCGSSGSTLTTTSPPIFCL